MDRVCVAAPAAAVAVVATVVEVVAMTLEALARAFAILDAVMYRPRDDAEEPELPGVRRSERDDRKESSTWRQDHS